MRRRVIVLCFSLLAWLAAESAPTWAHHSMAMYDQQKNITITGIVARVELKNPHSLFYITVTDKDGKEVDWTLECQPLATLSTYGWSQTTMKVGDKVTAVGSPARNGSPTMLVRAIQLPDGRSIRT
jgi:methionine-rich copper-binding protein CopC